MGQWHISTLKSIHMSYLKRNQSFSEIYLQHAAPNWAKDHNRTWGSNCEKRLPLPLMILTYSMIHSRSKTNWASPRPLTSQFNHCKSSCKRFCHHHQPLFIFNHYQPSESHRKTIMNHESIAILTIKATILQPFYRYHDQIQTNHGGFGSISLNTTWVWSKTKQGFVKVE